MTTEKYLAQCKQDYWREIIGASPSLFRCIVHQTLFARDGAERCNQCQQDAYVREERGKRQEYVVNFFKASS